MKDKTKTAALLTTLSVVFVLLSCDFAPMAGEIKGNGLTFSIAIPESSATPESGRAISSETTKVEVILENNSETRIWIFNLAGAGKKTIEIKDPLYGSDVKYTITTRDDEGLPLDQVTGVQSLSEEEINVIQEELDPANEFVIYTDVGVSASGNGLSWEKGVKTLDEAITKVKTIIEGNNRYTSAVIRMKAGTYGATNTEIDRDSLTRTAADLNLEIIGGFDGTEITSAPEGDDTDLENGSSSGNNPLLIIDGWHNLTIKNISFIGGHSESADVAGGLTIKGDSRNIRVVDSLFIRNESTNGSGGGIFIGKTNSGTPSEITIEDSLFFNNETGGGDGGALYVKDITGAVTIRSTLFADNEANGKGGAIAYRPTVDASGVNFVIDKSTLYSNRASGSTGKALYVEGGVLSGSGKNFSVSSSIFFNLSTELEIQSGSSMGVSFTNCVMSTDPQALGIANYTGNNVTVDRSSLTSASAFNDSSSVVEIKNAYRNKLWYSSAVSYNSFGAFAP